MAYRRIGSLRQMENGEWPVADLYLAAWLDARGHAVIRVDNSKIINAFAPNGLFAFIFADSNCFESDYRDFRADKPMEIRKYINSILKLKKLLRDCRAQACGR